MTTTRAEPRRRPAFGGSTRKPFSAVLPFQVLHYPIPQLMTAAAGRPWHNWPPPMPDGLRAWSEQTAHLGSSGNQIYVHVPFCPFYCHFCSLYKTQDGRHRNAATIERFVTALEREIAGYAAMPHVAAASFRTVYFGGGTPTQLSPGQLRRILSALQRSLRIEPDAEITLEGVATRLADAAYLSECLAVGFNRISFGVQTLDADLRLRIGRGEHVRDYAAVLDTLAALGDPVPFNVDLMAGLPGQTLSSHLADVDTVAGWGTGSVDIYAYWMIPGTRLFNKVRDGQRESPQYGPNLLEMRRAGKRALIGHGFRQLTGEAYVRGDPDAFMQTTFGAGGNSLNTALSLGPSAVGLLAGTLYQNTADLDSYLTLVEGDQAPVGRWQTLTPDVARKRATMFGLQRLCVPKEVIRARDRRLFHRWAAAGLLTERESAYDLGAEGSLWYNQMQLALLSLAEQTRLTGLMGTSREQRAALQVTRRGSKDVAGQLTEQILSEGPVRGPLKYGAYRSLLELQRLPFVPDHAMTFGGRLQQ